MPYHKLLKTILLLSLTFFITACTGFVGGTCKYDTITTSAVVKKVTNDYVTFEYLSYFTGEKVESVDRHLPKVYVGEILPLEIGVMTHGACVPMTYEVNKEDYFSIKGMVIPFTNDGKLKEGADVKIEFLSKHFLSLKKDYPDAVLSLYAYKDNKFSLSKIYSNQVKDMLIDEDISIKAIEISSRKRPVSTTFVNLPQNRVLFTVALYGSTN